MSPLKVLLVEDDPATCNAFIAYADQLEDISLVGVTADSDEAIKLIQDCLPEAIILDLELRKGGGSGLDVLYALRQMELPVRPYVMIVTNSYSDITLEYARPIGADYIISKHQRRYSEQYVLDLLRPMKEAIRHNFSAGASQDATPETPAEKKKRITQRIHAELDAVGIAPNRYGYTYLTEAILMTMEKPRTYICDELAEIHPKKSPSSIERAMQDAIKSAWSTTDIDQLLIHYTGRIKSAKGVPTLTEFIFYYANKLNAEYNI